MAGVGTVGQQGELGVAWEAEQHSLTIGTRPRTCIHTYTYRCKCNKMQLDIGRAKRERENCFGAGRAAATCTRCIRAYRVCSSSHAGHWHVPVIPCCWLCPIITFRRWIIIIESRDGWREGGGLHWFSRRAACSRFKPRCKRTSFHYCSYNSSRAVYIYI